MRGVQDVVTVWRKRLNDIKNQFEYTREVLPMLCKWNDTTVRTVTGGQAIVIQTVRIIIPHINNYNLDLQQGDYAALGYYDIDITDTAPARAADLKAKILTFIEIKTVTDNTRSALGKHYVVEGVR